MACANGLVVIGFVTIVCVVAVAGVFGSILEINVVAIIVPLLFSLQMDTMSLDFGLSLLVIVVSG